MQEDLGIREPVTASKVSLRSPVPSNPVSAQDKNSDLIPPYVETFDRLPVVLKRKRDLLMRCTEPIGGFPHHPLPYDMLTASPSASNCNASSP